ncbi:MAG: hypothetical protein NVSMB65_09010 [Chloroflexota bacterium]
MTVARGSAEVRTTTGHEPARPDEGEHLFQARFPASVHDWLRVQWFERRVAMTSVVLNSIHAVRNGAISLDAALQTESGEETTQRFTVRLASADYEWLRLESFQRRVPINRLLVAALEAYARLPQD